MHEIVTLQFGQRANYLATHFWNIQESYFTYTPNTEPSIIDHDIHFRPGIGTDGSDTYTPRTVIYDLKGGFGTLRQRNALYDDTSSSSSTHNAPTQIWNDSGLTTIKQQAIVPTSYQADLDAGLPTTQLRKSDVRYWSDFNRVFFHPRSIVQLNEYTLHSQLTPFESWSAGEDLFRDVDREADSGVLDRDVRLFAEECDSLQGFQVFAGTDDAWGGWTNAYIDGLRDEFGKKAIWVYGIEDERQVQREKAVARKANAARSLAGMSGLVDGYVRLSTKPRDLPGYVKMDASSEWESTALMAAAVESVTLAMRLRGRKGRGNTMAEFEGTLSGNEGRNVWELGMKIVSNALVEDTSRMNGTLLGREVKAEDEGEEDDAETYDINFMPESSSLLPNTLSSLDKRQPRKHVFAQIDTSRHPKRSSNAIAPSQPLDREEMLRRRYNEKAIVERFTVPLGFPRLDAYPADLLKDPGADTAYTGQVHEIGLSAGLTTGSKVKQSVFELRDLVTRYSRAVGVEEKEELYNGLTEVGEKYAFGWEDDDSGEDE